MARFEELSKTAYCVEEGEVLPDGEMRFMDSLS
jgi:hypothetical protein